MAAHVLLRTAWNVVITIPIGLVLHDHIACLVPSGVRNAGNTMDVCKPDEVLLVRRVLPTHNQPVVFTNPFASKERVVARIVGMPGDVYIEDDRESGLHSVQRLHPGQLWVQDDSDSEEAHTEAEAVDSRDFGPLPSVMVEGKPLAVVWPPSAMRLLE